MTIYGTPGGTPLNTSPFQGTTPGNVSGLPLLGAIANLGVGLFPPNSNTNSGDSVLAAVSRGVLPMNALLINGRIGTTPRAVLETLGTAGAQGTSNPIGGPSFNNAANGGGGIGAGGENQEQGSSSGISSVLIAAAPASAPSITGQPNYQG